MAEEFEFFSTDSNNWNFNIMINNPDHDPYNNNKKLDPSDIMYINAILSLC